MSRKSILVLPGDGPGAEFVRRATELIGLLAPDVEITEAQYGRACWENTNEVLPPETEDAIAEAKYVFCGPCDTESIGRRNPIRTIISYNTLSVRAVEYTGLPRVCPSGIDACIVSPVPYITRQFKEMESLNGVNSACYTDSDDAQGFFEKCIRLARRRGRDRIRHVTSREIFPHAARLSKSVFSEVTSGCDLTCESLDMASAMEILVSKPTDAGMMVGGPVAVIPLRSAANGISGGVGLMADTFLGDALTLYTACIENPAGRSNNPTSTFLAASDILLDLGYEDESRTVRESIWKTYKSKEGIRRTNNAFDRLPDEFISSVIRYVNGEEDAEFVDEEEVLES